MESLLFNATNPRFLIVFGHHRFERINEVFYHCEPRIGQCLRRTLRLKSFTKNLRSDVQTWLKFDL